MGQESSDFGFAVLCAVLLGGCFFLGRCTAPDAAAPEFPAAQCSELPTGRTNNREVLIKDQDGKPLGTRSEVTGREWVKACARSEWR